MEKIPLYGAVFSFMGLIDYIRQKYCKSHMSPQLEKYRSIDALYDRDEVIYLDDIGYLQTIEVDGLQQKVLSKQILKNAPHHLHIPFLTGSSGDAGKFEIIMNSFCSFKENYKIQTLFHKTKIKDDVSWLVYYPKKVIAIMVVSDNRHRHYVSYYLDDKNELFMVRGKFVRFNNKKLEVYKRFEFFVKNDKVHNEGKWAAKVSIKDTKDMFFWMQNNELHNLDGPAVIREDGEKSYYTYGRLYKT
jgi:hypothetical protein